MIDSDPKDDAESWERVQREGHYYIDDIPPGERNQGIGSGYWRREREGGEEGEQRR